MEAGTLTVGELALGIERALSSWFTGELWIAGEIASLRRSASGHVYFQLVERDDDDRVVACVDVALFDAARRYVNQQLKRAGGARMTDGMSVRVRGRLEHFAAQGRLQLRMSGIDPDYTLAQVLSERDRVLARLEAEELLDRNGRLPLDVLPLRLGLVTSDGSAAHADFVHELEASGYAWRVRLAHVPVQGHGADRLVAAALRTLGTVELDVVALVRGGGSRIDLAVFDSERIARAIVASPVPVVTGIGHEIDRSVADVVAYAAYKTPTACAAALVDRVREGARRAEDAWAALHPRASALLHRLDTELVHGLRSLPVVARARIDAGEAALARAAATVRERPGRSLLGAARDVDQLGAAVTSRVGHLLERADQRLALHDAAVSGADPTRLMARGWSITRTAGGQVVRSAAEVSVGERLTTTVADGAIISEVQDTEASTDPLRVRPEDEAS